MAEKHLTSFDAHLTAQYGERGTPAREEFEKGFATFRISVTINELQKKISTSQIYSDNVCRTIKTTSDNH